MLQDEVQHLCAVLGNSVPARLLEQICCCLDFVEVSAIGDSIKYIVGHDCARTVLSEAKWAQNFISTTFSKQMKGVAQRHVGGIGLVSRNARARGLLFWFGNVDPRKVRKFRGGAQLAADRRLGHFASCATARDVGTALDVSRD